MVLIVGEAISAQSSCEVILRERCNQSVIIELKGMGVSATLLQNLFSFSSVTIQLSFLHDYLILKGCMPVEILIMRTLEEKKKKKKREKINFRSFKLPLFLVELFLPS